jgi:hypothetical protein
MACQCSQPDCYDAVSWFPGLRRLPVNYSHRVHHEIFSNSAFLAKKKLKTETESLYII